MFMKWCCTVKVLSCSFPGKPVASNLSQFLLHMRAFFMLQAWALDINLVSKSFPVSFFKIVAGFYLFQSVPGLFFNTSYLWCVDLALIQIANNQTKSTHFFTQVKACEWCFSLRFMYFPLIVRSTETATYLWLGVNDHKMEFRFCFLQKNFEHQAKGLKWRDNPIFSESKEVGLMLPDEVNELSTRSQKTRMNSKFTRMKDNFLRIEPSTESSIHCTIPVLRDAGIPQHFQQKSIMQLYWYFPV